MVVDVAVRVRLVGVARRARGLHRDVGIANITTLRRRGRPARRPRHRDVTCQTRTLAAPGTPGAMPDDPGMVRRAWAWAMEEMAASEAATRARCMSCLLCSEDAACPAAAGVGKGDFLVLEWQPDVVL